MEMGMRMGMRMGVSIGCLTGSLSLSSPGPFPSLGSVVMGKSRPHFPRPVTCGLFWARRAFHLQIAPVCALCGAELFQQRKRRLRDRRSGTRRATAAGGMATGEAYFDVQREGRGERTVDSGDGGTGRGLHGDYPDIAVRVLHL